MSKIQAILIDTREPAWMQKLSFGDALVSVAPLEAGDVQAITDDSELLVIERKTPEDFLGSVKDQRIFKQAVKMRSTSEWCYVVITGPFIPTNSGRTMTGDRITGWSYAAIQGAILSLQELGCFVMFCNGDTDFANAVQRIATRDRGSVSVRAARDALVLSPAENALAMLPGIGMERLQALLKDKTPAEALCWLTNPFDDGIQGIGEGTKNAVRKALQLGENSQLRIMDHLDIAFLGLDNNEKVIPNNLLKESFDE